MTTNYLELHQHLEDRLTQFGRELPGPMTGFARLHKKAVEDDALSAKVKALMALAISIAVGCEGCIAYHTHDAIQAGATRPELLEMIGVGVMTLAPRLRAAQVQVWPVGRAQSMRHMPGCRRAVLDGITGGRWLEGCHEESH